MNILSLAFMDDVKMKEAMFALFYLIGEADSIFYTYNVYLKSLINYCHQITFSAQQ